ncbi:MAG: TnpV protein [Defluviitaleaceae bacterium]|nr:TnpV protein [Defluviitaleaceae bacterium]
MTATKTGRTPAPKVEITYRWEGDYLIPDIGIPETEKKLPSLTKWGLMRKNFLKEHRRIIYTDLKMSGKLFLHCHEIEEQAKDRIESMMAQMVKANPVSEDLKNTDPMAWVGHMNALKAQVEEIIKTELIYG